MAISNRYKNTIDDFIDSSDIGFLEFSRSESILIDARLDLWRDFLDKNGRGQRNKERRRKSNKRSVVRADNGFEISIHY